MPTLEEVSCTSESAHWAARVGCYVDSFDDTTKSARFLILSFGLAAPFDDLRWRAEVLSHDLGATDSLKRGRHHVLLGCLLWG